VRHALAVSSRQQCFIHHPEVAAHTRIAIAHARAVGSLLAAKLAGVVAPLPDRDLALARE